MKDSTQPPNPTTKPPKPPDISTLRQQGSSFFGGEKIQGGEAEEKKVARIKLGADLWRVVDQASLALSADPELYQREGALVMVVDKGSGPSISVISRATLKERLTRVAEFLTRKDEKEDSWIVVKPTPDLVDALYDRKNWGLRYLSGFRDAPFLRPDGSVCQKIGYDEKTRFILTSGTRFPHIPESPDRAQALAALAQIQEIICDFPFAAPEYKSSWIALVLTLFARPAIDGPCPFFGIDANTRGSGKTRLADLASILLTGKEATRTIQTDNDEEMRKRALANLIEGNPFTLLDNIRGIMGGATLEAITTGPSFGDRFLGKSENLSLPALTVWAGTGNNLTYTDDFARRTLPIRLESPLENPESRNDFKIPNLILHAKQQRPALVAAILTIWRAWFVAGRPCSQDLNLWGSFEAWSSLVLPVFTWLDLPSPLLAHEALTQNDSNKGAVYSFFYGLTQVLERRKATDLSAREILDEAYPTQTLSGAGYSAAMAFRAVLEDLCGLPSGKQPSAKQLGANLRRYKGRRVHDLILIGKEDRNGITRWYIKPVEEDSNQRESKT